MASSAFSSSNAIATSWRILSARPLQALHTANVIPSGPGAELPACFRAFATSLGLTLQALGARGRGERAAPNCDSPICVLLPCHCRCCCCALDWLCKHVVNEGRDSSHLCNFPSSIHGRLKTFCQCLRSSSAIRSGSEVTSPDSH